MERKSGLRLTFLALLCLVSSQALFGQLPSVWSDGDIGAVGLQGSATYANGVFTVNAAGSGITSGSADAFHFAYQPLSGDGSIIARVVSATQGATVGVMVRETLDAGSTEGSTDLSPSSGSYVFAEFEERSTTGGANRRLRICGSPRGCRTGWSWCGAGARSAATYRRTE